MKVAVTAVAALTVTVHAPVPEQAPLQLAKTEPAAGAAVRVTAVTGVTDCAQVAPQLMPAGLLVTVPLPGALPALLTDSAKVDGGAVPTVKGKLPEAAPEGLCTETWAVPWAAISAAAIAAVNRVALTNVVPRAAPFQRTVAPDTKLLPLTVSVKAGPPAVALLGDRELSAGAAGGDPDGVHFGRLQRLLPGELHPAPLRERHSLQIDLHFTTARAQRSEEPHRRTEGSRCTHGAD